MLEENHKRSSDYILVSIGTGSSIFHVTAADSERIAGSGIGGGTLMGLGSLIAGNKDFAALTQLASKGNHEHSDLLVKDIYAPNEPPVPGSLTAANFGKAHVNSSATVEDHLAALMQLIGETILSLAWQAAVSKQIRQIIFVGSTLTGNTPLKNVLGSFQETLLYEPLFPQKGAYAGAIGAMLL
ncbi:pantothenate kinase [Oceanobacillus massiliensis]|uniref:pantothenate kinase n=1 Tax=Oceanobacillus massiliensis TaxID=1465765 RepID=UPI0002887A6F|nr:pantothenate kinase [Oceanobacillus massiliensis]